MCKRTPVQHHKAFNNYSWDRTYFFFLFSSINQEDADATEFKRFDALEEMRPIVVSLTFLPFISMLTKKQIQLSIPTIYLALLKKNKGGYPEGLKRKMQRGVYLNMFLPNITSGPTNSGT